MEILKTSILGGTIFKTTLFFVFIPSFVEQLPTQSPAENKELNRYI